MEPAVKLKQREVPMQKRKIAIVASGITSPLFNMLEFAERVAQDGWQVQIFAPETARACR